jgi:hypothetical protein
MSLPRILLHVPNLKINSISTLVKKDGKPMYINRIYNLAHFKYIDYNHNTKTLTITYNDNSVYKILEEPDDTVPLQTTYQEIARILLTNENTKVIRS